MSHLFVEKGGEKRDGRQIALTRWSRKRNLLSKAILSQKEGCQGEIK